MTFSKLLSPRTKGRGRDAHAGRRLPTAALATLTVMAPLVLGGVPASAHTDSAGERAQGIRQLAAGIISAFAGGVGGPGPATTVALGNVYGVTYGGGHAYVADGPLRAVEPGTDQLTTTAGDTVQNIGPLGDGGRATRAYVDSAGTPAVDGAGNLVIPDTGHARVRVVARTSGTFYGQKMTAGHIYSVAGNGRPGFSSSGVPATKAPLMNPAGVAVDSAGNLVLADSGMRNPKTPSRIQVVAVKTGTFYGQKMTAGDIYNIAGVSGLGVSGNGGPALHAGLGTNIGQVELDSMGDVVIADDWANSIRVIAEKTGTIYGQPMTAGDIYAVAGNGKRGFSGDGGPATQAELNEPQGVTVDGAGNLVVADTDNGRVRVVAVTSGTFYGQKMTAGHIYSIAGGGTGPGISPDGVAIDGAGNVLIADYAGYRVRLIAVKTGTFYRQKMTADHLYTIAGNGRYQYSGNGGPATKAVLDFPGYVAFGSADQLAVSDNGNNRLRLVPARSGTYFGQQMTAGHIYTVAGDGRCNQSGATGDGGPALKATMCEPLGLRFDSAGNLLFTDEFSHRVRVVAEKTGTFYGQRMTVGFVYPVAGNGKEGFSGDGGPATAAEFDSPTDVAVDGAGNLIIPDILNNRVRVVAEKTGTFYGVKMTTGDVYTVAGTGKGGLAGDGGPALEAEFYHPTAVAVDSAGNLLIADLINDRIRVVAATSGTFYGIKMTVGDIYTVAGSSHGAGFSGDGGPAVKARLAKPEGVGLDPAGNLLIGDTENNRVRVVAVKSGTFYGIKMTANDIYTVAGDGTLGFNGVGKPAVDAELWQPTGVAAGSAGNLFFGGPDRVFEVSG